MKKKQDSRPSAPVDFQEAVRKNLAALKQYLADIAIGDFSKKPDLSAIADADFVDVFRGIDIMLDDQQATQADLQEQNSINSLRAEIWKLASDKTLTEEQLIRELLELIGPFLKVMRASFNEYHPAENIVELTLQWCAPGVDGTIGLRHPSGIYSFILGKSVVILKDGALPEGIRDAVAPLLKQFGAGSYLILPYPLPNHPEGFFTFSDPDSKRAWHPWEINLAVEIIRIASVRTLQIKAEHALQKANDALAQRVKEQSAELSESEAHFKAVAQSAQEAIITAGQDGTIRYWNPGAELILGYAAEEVVGRSFEFMIPENYLQRHRASMRNAAVGPGRTMESRAVRKNGEEFPVEVSISTWESGSGVFHTAILRDITERKKAEERLRERERFLANVFSSIQDGISILDNEYNIVRVNPTMEKMYPHSMPLPGKKCYAAYHGRSEICELCPTRRIFETGQSAYEIVPLHNAGGDITGWLDLYTFPLHDSSSGKLTGVIEYVRDISDRVKAQNELADEKEFLDVTLRSIGEGVVSTDVNGSVLLMNSGAEKLTGWSRAEAIGQPLGHIFHIVNEHTRAFCPDMVKEVLRRGVVINYAEARLLIARDGTERLIAASGAPIRNRDGAIVGVAVVFRDVTEQQRLEEELFKARKLESIGLLAGGIAHDFNNILTGIVTNLFMAKMNAQDNEEVLQLIVGAEKAAFRASRLTKQLLTFAKGGSPVKEATSLKQIIEDAVGFCLSGSNVDYKIETPDDLRMVEVDRGQIDQVLNNLVINADQAMPNGGTIAVKAENITISEEITTGTASFLPLMPGNYVKVSVIDEGIGIPPADLERIFDPYFTTKQEGSGLGLTTAFSIVKKHGGHITVKSALGKGSRFIFYLPAAKSDADEDESGKLPPPRLPESTRILVMDDDEIVRMVVTRLLSSNGYAVECAVRGEEAIGKYESAYTEGRPFDVVVMDLTVPGGMGGKEAMQKILAIDPKAKAIVFSGYSNDPVLANYREYGFSGVIEKPFSIDEFMRVLSRIMTESDGGASAE